MSVCRVTIRHIELGFVDIEIGDNASAEDIEDLVRETFNNGNAIITSSIVEVASKD